MSSNYYEKHREEILAKRKYRYDHDEEFRKRHVEAVKKYDAKKLAERKALKKRLKEEKKIWKLFNINGVITPCCNVRYLSAHLDRKTQCIRLWEKKGLIPRTFMYKGYRYYPKYHFALMVKAWRNIYNGSTHSLHLFFEAVWKDWESEKEKWVKQEQLK